MIARELRMLDNRTNGETVPPESQAGSPQSLYRQSPEARDHYQGNPVKRVDNKHLGPGLSKSRN